LPRSPSSLCLMARYARCDVRRKPPSSSDPTKRLCRKSALFSTSFVGSSCRSAARTSRADRALQPAAVLVARRGKNASAHSSSERRERDPGGLTASLAPKVVRNDMRHADAACCLRPLCVRKRSASNLTALSKQGRKGRPSVFSKLFAVRQSRR
jgi:hypothetical protein